VKQAGYLSSYAICNAHEAGVSHHNHLESDVGVDFIFLQNFTDTNKRDTLQSVPSDETNQWMAEFTKSIPLHQVGKKGDRGWALSATESWLHPKELSDSVWPLSFGEISDHRPVVALFSLHQAKREEK